MCTKFSALHYSISLVKCYLGLHLALTGHGRTNILWTMAIIAASSSVVGVSDKFAIYASPSERI